MDDEAQQFLSSLEAKYGGPVGYRTYSTWFASNDGVVREFGVFLFLIGSTFHFEDFERKPSLFGFPLKTSKKAPPYVKYEQSFSSSDVKSVIAVAKSMALSCAYGDVRQEDIKEANRFVRMFRPIVFKVELLDGTVYFFELIDHKKFVKELEESKHGSI
ncbi:MAG: hypothetical protein PHU24_01745 [Sphaerochaetaceae bacterium]|jgi:hypothetical protein|nr:hypothetical protein [Sphaerochaetaceae bacterium]NLO60962.1 hypothetical protein [Spirochaetales bacterium]MDD2405160.1 hypothetical protein [Sphaerochaetaceae bacterium]MDD3670049.1 hypothetical protein [Sphaerochaetaceae bacterium]MDD4259346.1 hypothetical protein [Sphaerochaetaceae bacterium]